MSIVVSTHQTPDARSFLTDLSDVVQTGIHVLLWGGEDGKNSHLSTTRSMAHVLFSSALTDWLANVAGVEEVIAEIKFDQSAEFNAAPLSPFTIEGTEYGRYKTAGNLSYLRVFNAGHQASSFQPKLAQEVFRQTINLEVLYST
jgi:carboxypeptidase C (cathepsin A)